MVIQKFNNTWKNPPSSMRIIKGIILHCSAEPEGRDTQPKQIEYYHHQRGFTSIGYHYLITLDGTVWETRPIIYSGAHCEGKNGNYIGICYIGGMNKEYTQPKDTRTDAQKESLFTLVTVLMKEHNLKLDDIYGHYQFSKKACPSFKIDDWKKEYKEWLDGKDI